MIVSNPPYLTTDETDERVNGSWKEPSLALDGGDDGLDLIRILIPQAAERLVEGGYLLIEAAPRQMEGMATLMKDAGFDEIRTALDLAGHERVILGRLG
jgi:release factor glutamine methyltransferase